MKKLKYKDIDYTSIQINSDFDSYKSEFSLPYLKDGDCLRDSKNIADSIAGSKIVEGWVISKYVNGGIGCIAHAWIEIEGGYFDITCKKLLDNKEIASVDHYLIKAYPPNEANIEKKLDIRKGNMGQFVSSRVPNLNWNTIAFKEQKELRALLEEKEDSIISED